MLSSRGVPLVFRGCPGFRDRGARFSYDGGMTKPRTWRGRGTLVPVHSEACQVGFVKWAGGVLWETYKAAQSLTAQAACGAYGWCAPDGRPCSIAGPGSGEY